MEVVCKYKWTLPLTIVFVLLVAMPAKLRAEHAIILTDIEKGSRIQLEAGIGKAIYPIKSDALHYLLHMELEVIENGHFRLGVPFSGYAGPMGQDNFIRGNLMTGFSYSHPFTDWFRMGAVARLYFPTYESTEAEDFGFPADPRRAALTHWHTRFGYAFEDYFPMEAQAHVKFQQWGLFFQLESGWTYALRTAKNRWADRPRNVWLYHYGGALGYTPIKYIEFQAAIAGLLDPETSAANLEALTANPTLKERSHTTASTGLRLAYEWAYASFSASFPLEQEFRRALDPFYLISFGVQFGRLPPYDGWGPDGMNAQQ